MYMSYLPQLHNFELIPAQCPVQPHLFALFAVGPIAYTVTSIRLRDPMVPQTYRTQQSRGFHRFLAERALLRKFT